MARAEEVNSAINELKGLGSPVKQLVDGVDKAEKEALNEAPRDSTDDENLYDGSNSLTPSKYKRLRKK